MKKISAVFYPVVLAVLSLFFATTVHATNGMNLEGYGPIATGMGGASMAYDNGTAAMMNNPATLGLMPEGDRLDLALGYLGPHITSSMPGMPDAKSSADAFYMPAFGLVKKTGQVTYGVGVFSQGGMGTEYDATSFLAMGSGQEVRSELGVGRVIIPVAYNVTPNFNIGGSIDYVWASLDLEMAASGAQLGSLVTGCGGAGCAALPALAGAPWARIDFSGGGRFNGAATGDGVAAKIGATYKVSSDFSVGATYHSKTALSDLRTTGNGAAISAAGVPGVVGNGTITVRNFQWPATYGAGAAWNATKDLMIVADIKLIEWKDVMKSFKLSYDGGIFGAPTGIDFALPQNWKNQTVYELGVGYKVAEPLTVRAGANLSRNPIPDTYLNPLFPATIKDHYMVGLGFMLTKAASLDASYTYAPKVHDTTPQGITVSHFQTNAQVMYSYRF
jgi:long-chain fatty acid transport protein